MKKILTVFLLAAMSGIGATVKLAWDANSPSDNIIAYRVYEKIGVNYILLSTVGTNLIVTLSNVTVSDHTYSVTASNLVGESVQSIPVTVTAAQLTPPNPPTNLRVISVGP